MDTWGLRKTIGAVAAAAAIAGVGGAAIAAATDGSNSFAGGMHGPGGPPPAAAHGPGVAPHGADLPPGSLHGEYVIADGSGGFLTKMSQTGRVTAISATSVTARSDDGFTRTYVIRVANGAAAPPFSVGEVVVVGATQTGPNATVDTLGQPLAPGH